VQAAISEATSTSKQLEREASARGKLEQTVRELERQLGSGATTREEWRTETTALIESIQKECHAIFDRNKSPREPSATSVMHFPSRSSATEPLAQPKVSFEFDETPRTSAATSKPNEASTLSQMDRTLEETEALVRSLVGEDLGI
jgi:hypothetical protein